MENRSYEINIEAIRKKLENSMGVKFRPKNIRSITVNPSSHQLPKMKIEVGQICKNLEPDAAPEKVLAIFEAASFLVCTQKRGVESSLPYFFARQDILQVEEYPDNITP